MQTFIPSNINTTAQGSVHLNKFIINPTRVTPAVNLIPDKQYLIIKGRSCPDNAQSFYSRVYQSIDSYNQLGKKALTVFFNLEYFNTSSAKCIFDLFKKLQTTSSSGMEIVVNWYYEEEDEDMLESGEDFSEFFNFSFNLVSFHLD